MATCSYGIFFLLLRTKVANLAFLKPDVEILPFLNTFSFFGK